MKDAFAILAADHASELGASNNGNGGPLKATDSYQSWHEHAIIYWIGPPVSKICAVPFDLDRPVLCHDDFWDADPKWFPDKLGDAKLRRLFPGIPNDKFPPIGGIARAWLQNKAKYSTFGYVTRDCYNEGVSYYQTFEKGIIFGPFRRDLKLTDAYILAVPYDMSARKVSSRSVSLKLAACRDDGPGGQVRPRGK